MLNPNKSFYIDSETEVFIYCPAGLVTGGSELLHQLCDFLNRNNQNAYIIYYGDAEKKIPDDYKKYSIKLKQEVNDKKNNIVVLCEVFFHYVFKFKNIQPLFWWLSVDNFYFSQEVNLNISEYYKWNKKLLPKVFLRKIKGFGKFENRFWGNFNLKKINTLNGIHGYQSEYAKDFLLKHGINNIVPLKDYINTDYNQNFNTSVKENIIVYNPKKGLAFTKKLIKLTPELKWVPIQNMSRAEVLSLLERSKLYIDFGYHPGKDRLPREAALNGCCIITGKLGAAGYYGDIPISPNYKFEQRNIDIPIIIKSIYEILDLYESKILDFANYRQIILGEKDEFENDILKIFQIKV